MHGLPKGAVQRVVLRLDLTPGPFPTREGEPWFPLPLRTRVLSHFLISAMFGDFLIF